MTSPPNSIPEIAGNDRRRQLRVFVIEMIVGFVLILLFAGMAIQSFEWPREANLFPQMVAGMGIVFTLLYVAQQWLRRRRQLGPSQDRVLDIAWTNVSDDHAYARRAAIIAVLSMVAFWIGIILVGFHVAAPLYIYSQLVILGGQRHWHAALGAIVVLLVVILVYGKLIGTTWNDPLLFDWVKDWWTGAA